MIRIKPMTEEYEWRWVHDRIHLHRPKDSQGLVAYDDKTGKIAGIVIMDTWNAAGCHVHFAIDNPLCIRRGLFHEVSRHIHTVGERKYMFGMVPANNKKSLNLTKRLGFTEVCRIPDAYAEGIDLAVMRISREENTYLRKEPKEKAA